nr:unnamed protein product [Digitaria exilis]
MGKDVSPPGKAASPLRSFSSVFVHADVVDVVLMVLGLVGAIGDGISTPVMLVFVSRILNDVGDGPDLIQNFTSRINQNARNFLFLGDGELEAYCWTRTAERQASRMRARYLRAVLRQDVEYFDLNAGGGSTTSEVVTGVSNDSLAVQDALSEKVPNFVMNITMFVGSYAIGFVLLWRLALVALPSMLLLVVPGFLYGRILIGLARQVRDQYTRPGAIAEQAVSSVRTVYSFVAEQTTMAKFSAALEESTRLGIKQGLAKGLAIGSNGVTFAIYAFNVWYGSRLVMYHGAKGGTVYVVSAGIVVGGMALGSGLSNVKYFSEASSAAERILEVIRRVPKIDSEQDTGEKLANVAGEVEFRNVEFCYPSRPESPVLVSFNLKVPAGCTMALVGTSGSGKSTVIALLQRFYDPSAGEVTLDGVDIRQLRLKWLRAQMGLVSQEPALFAMSIRENILFGKEDATEEEVVAAAKAANAHNFISELPQGYDTQVKELGSHDELIANETGPYTSLVRLQQTKDSREADEDDGIGRTSAMGQSRSHNMSRRFSTVSRSSSPQPMDDAGDHDNNKNHKLPIPSFRRLLMLNAPEWKQALMGSFSSILFGGIQPLHAYTMGSMYSIYFVKDHEEIKKNTRIYALIFVSLAVVSFVLNIGQHYNFGAMGEYLTKRIREQMLEKILTFEIGWFDRDENSSGAICSQLAKGANIVRSLVGDRMSLVVQTVSAVLIACIMGLAIAWRLALVMMAVQPLIIVSYYARHFLLKSISKKSMQAQSECSKLASEAVSNLRIITAFSSQGRILHLFEQAQDSPRKEGIRQSWFAGLCLGTSMSLLRCTWALAFWYGGMLMADHQITAKALFQTFMILCLLFLTGKQKIEPNNLEGYEPEKIIGEVDIKEVEFSYPSRPDVLILRGFSLNIQPGKSTALVGQSGSGKSTIIGLIERFYDPLRGVVQIDGRDMKTYNLRAIRHHIGLVSQEPTLFAGTVRENIVYGTDSTSEEEIETAARYANAHDFISNLKDGYDTWCGDRGVQLSGGQKQRIAIARAILKNPTILLLDEATSALDSQSEKVVQEALERVMVGRTSVVVAHRLSTIQDCDLIAVLEKGIVVEKGTHASLMAKGPSGTYFGLVSLQQGGNQHLDA